MTKKILNAKTLKNQLFGIWKDNDLVQNVDEYVRKLRNGIL